MECETCRAELDVSSRVYFTMTDSCDTVTSFMVEKAVPIYYKFPLHSFNDIKIDVNR